MRRLASLLLLLPWLMTSPAWASSQSLGVTVAPAGAFLLTRATEGHVAGYSAALGWSYRRADALVEVGGNITTSQVLTTATPMTVRFTPLRDAPFRPFLGLGASLLVPHVRAVSGLATHPGLLVGAELSGGLGVELGGGFFFTSEARYQNFSAQGDPLSGERQEMLSAFLGLGLHL
ncbi:hypothetical protein [Hyalangium rubrum]|uniref:Outer membrane protein beta-barrel domain-containing protein n=1 Tax=Hyalangium rubrum TaxID=3103134 RepID=A0ABU5H713_9BACT|nr:hypothetical protein [Hyalangium sp. s54d21]MDY7229264.1 hypothetical protein [Hyalangium sp. s54d21]